MDCIRCGRKIPDGRSFCDACTAVVQEPLPESAYISTHISIPQRRAEPVRAAARQKQKPHKPQRSKGLIRAVVCLSLVCVLLLGACGFGLTYYFKDYRRDRNRLRLQEEDLTRRQDEIAQMQTDLEAARSELALSKDTLSDRDREITRLNQEINTYKIQGSETDQTIRELQEENLRLIGESEELSAQMAALNGTVGELQKQVGSLTDINTILQQKSDFFDDHVAFVENDGTGYYHRYSCSHFKKEGYWAFSINLAISRGYTACPYCGG